MLRVCCEFRFFVNTNAALLQNPSKNKQKKKKQVNFTGKVEHTILRKKK